MTAEIKFEELVSRKISHIQVRGEGVVSSILNDDLKGRKHQRFVLRLAHHKTLLILNNIDIFPRLEPLEIGDRVEFYGEYVWNRHGGALHWTHHDPNGKRDDGYVKVVTDDNSGELQDSDEIRLASFEAVYQEIFADLKTIPAQLEQLKAEGKEKTVRYRELFGRKLMNNYVISLFERHGITF